MNAATAVSLLLFAVLAVMFVIVVRRASRLVAETRDLDRFKTTVAQLDRRVGAVVEPLLGRLDEVRFRRAGPEIIIDALPPATAELDSAAEEARALIAPPGLADVPVALAREIERAERAIELIDHGSAALRTIRATHRELEAQTSLKRGALNLRHAREAVSVLGNRVASVEHPSAARRRRRTAAMTAAAPAPPQPPSSAEAPARPVVVTPPSTLVERGDNPSDPSM